MGLTRLYATVKDVRVLVLDWGKSQGLSWSDKPTPSGRYDNEMPEVLLTMNGDTREVVVRLSEEDDRCLAHVVVKSTLLRCLLINGLLFAGLVGFGWQIRVMGRGVIQSWEWLVPFLASVTSMLVGLAWMRRTMRRHTDIERLLWAHAEQQFRAETIAPSGGRVAGAWFDIPFMAGLAVVMAWIVSRLGSWAFVWCALIFMPGLLGVLLETGLREVPWWKWKLRILLQMMSWTSIVIALLSSILVMVVSEGIMVRWAAYYRDGSQRPGHLLDIRDIREVKAGRSDVAEKQTRALLTGLCAEAVARSPHATITSGQLCRIISVGILFGVMGVWAMLQSIHFVETVRRARRWRVERNKGWEHGPHVPAVKGAWRSEPFLIKGGAVVYYLFSGALNVIAAGFCADGLAYSLLGHSVIGAKTASLWSWLFVSAEQVFGGGAGRKIGVGIVVAFSLPFLAWGLVVLRRVWALAIRMLGGMALAGKRRAHRTAVPSFVKECAEDLCRRAGLPPPLVRIRTTGLVGAEVGWLPPPRSGLLEISERTLEVLDADETRALVAHEVGHIKQGLFWVATLKVLSSLYPNYLLLLCVNWPRREMLADQFALDMGIAPEILRRAIVKVSTAALLRAGESGAGQERHVGNGHKMLRTMLADLKVVATFYFGDSILGYAHPFVSERLQAMRAAEANPGGRVAVSGIA